MKRTYIWNEKEQTFVEIESKDTLPYSDLREAMDRADREARERAEHRDHPGLYL